MFHLQAKSHSTALLQELHRLETESEAINFSMTSVSRSSRAGHTMSLRRKRGKGDAVHLPSEVLYTIMSYVKLQQDSQRTLYFCCLVSRAWHSEAVILLYQDPVLEEERYLSFVRAMRPSNSIPDLQIPLSEYVKTMDLSALPAAVADRVAQNLLARVERGLEGFVAPVTRFS
jgi:hypothetical protein